MSVANAFARAMTGRDHAAIVALLADDVVLHSPVSHRPHTGREIVGGLLCVAADILDDLTYTEELTGPEHTALTFTASVGGRRATGVDLLVADELVRKLTVALRPLSALTCFNELMGPRAAAVVARDRSP